MPKHELNFLEFLQSFRRGELLKNGDDKLAELMQAVCETGASGSITITLPFKMNKAGQIECTPEIKLKKPTKPMGTGIYFATDDAQLTRRDPNQLDMMDDLEERRGSHAAE
ncbi:hypothetical protein [uncultured Roseobacter sp.]|uniref:hypothetical protein n=1 Tax=uncultured Roseobacter sp. TaxID=114847 RepID=UPI002604C99B|nr:hypothetical protein [uncultured Roseobacter sp.]